MAVGDGLAPVHYYVAMDGKSTSVQGAQFLVDHFVSEQDKITLITVPFHLNPLTAGGRTKLENKGMETLQRQAAEIHLPVENSPQVSMDSLPAKAGPQTVGRSLDRYMTDKGDDAVLVMGPRKLTGFHNAAAQLPTGQRGSDAHVARHCPTRVLLAPSIDAVASPQSYLVAWDGLPGGADEALTWAARRLIRPGSTLYIAHVVNYPNKEVVDEEREAVDKHYLFFRKHHKTIDLIREAGLELDRLVRDTKALLPDGAQIRGALLPPSDGESQTGASIVVYAKKRGIDTILLGTRLRSRVKNHLATIFGDSSVTDYMLKNWEGGLFFFRPGQANV